MMKRTARLMALLLVLALLPAAALAAQGGEEFRLHGYVNGTLRFESSYLEPHEGPGYKYYRVSLNLPSGTKVKVLTQAMDESGNCWVMVEAPCMEPVVKLVTKAPMMRLISTPLWV